MIDRPSDELNGVGQMAFTISTHDPALLDSLVDPDTVDLGVGELSLIDREVEWWRDGEMRWAGIPVAADVSLDGTMRVQCYSLAWRLARRFVGAAERKDLSEGVGQMDEAGLPGWTRVGVTAVRNTTVKRRGAGSAQISGTGWMWHEFVHPPHGNESSIAVYLTAQVRVQTGTPDDEVLATINAYDVSTGVEVLPDREWNTAKVTQATLRDGWNTTEARCFIPPEGARVRWGFWNATTGNRYVDDARPMKNDTIGIPEGGDLTEHFRAIINHANLGRGKSDTGLKPVVLANTGTVEVLGIRHLEHTQILDVLKGYTDREDGFDWWVDPRTRRIYVAPRRGQDHEDLVLHEWNVMAGGWTHDESERSSSVVVPGEGDEITRAEGGAMDDQAIGGQLLDHFHRPPNGTPLASLDPIARSVLARLSKPQVTLDAVRVPGEWWPDVSPGDRFRVEVASGRVRPPGAPAWLRVQTVTCDLDTDTLELT